MLVLYSKAFLKATSAACKRPFCVKTLPKFPKAENKKKYRLGIHYFEDTLYLALCKYRGYSSSASGGI